jgi:4-amino-4-deoxy-L-arabinose transferase-like glycosyltransferase
MRFPELRNIDVVRYRGHVYSTKAPGLAAVSLPPYLALRTAGVETTGSPRRLVWALHLWGVVVPAAILLVLVRRRADRVEPGFGTITAVSLGTGSLILPFSTVFFSHVLSATLGFAAFAILARERETHQSSWLVLAGGLAAGLAFTVEYPLGVVVLALGLIVLSGADRVRRASIYALGVCLGALPTFAFNTWAFGTPFHLPQQGWHHFGSEPLPGLLGVTRPTLDNALRIVFYPGGIGPILLPALIGAVLLWRRDRRLQATLPIVVVGLLLLFNSASVDPFGGASPGPRFMIPALPFLALPLAVAYRAIPGATLGLVLGGAVFMVAATLTTALEAWDGLVFHRVITGRYVESVASFVGLRGSAFDAPFLLALAVAVVAAIAATPWRFVLRRDAIAALVAFLAWLVLASRIKGLLEHGTTGEGVALVAAALAAGAVAAVYRIRLRLPTPVPPTESER